MSALKVWAQRMYCIGTES